MSNALTSALSAPQCVGYVAFVLGVAAFLQKSDRKLKTLNAAESLVYAVHFVLLGNLTACASTVVSGIRSLLAVKFRSPVLAAAIVAVNLALGLMLRSSGAGWLPVAASCTATVAVFLMRGIRMRLVLLGCTLLWLANNVLSGSIGGTALEASIAIINTTTIARLLRAHRKARNAEASLVS